MFDLIVKNHIFLGVWENSEYSVDGNNWYNTANEAIKSAYPTQGDFYEALGFTKRESYNMGWDPDVDCFDSNSQGWEAFLKYRKDFLSNKAETDKGNFISNLIEEDREDLEDERQESLF